MSEDYLVIEIESHTDVQEDCSIIRMIDIPDVDHLLYSLPDKPNEKFTREGFKSFIKKVSFKRTPELVIIVTDKRTGKSRQLVCPLTWPVEEKPGLTLSRQVFNLDKE